MYMKLFDYTLSNQECDEMALDFPATAKAKGIRQGFCFSLKYVKLRSLSKYSL